MLPLRRAKRENSIRRSLNSDREREKRMTEADRIFERFPDFIKEYIYSHSWDSLREVQTAAAECIFETDHDLLLTSSTASGKTEAAFFPILAELCRDMPTSVGVLYIAPLKALINDQFLFFRGCSGFHVRFG